MVVFYKHQQVKKWHLYYLDFADTTLKFHTLTYIN